MIRINLLPAKKRKAAKKITELQQQMVLGGLILILAGIGIGYDWIRLSTRIAELKQQKATAEAKVREQDNMLKEVKNVEEERKKVKEKIDIILQLQKNKTGPVRLLDEISKALPTGVNLTSLAEKSGLVDIEGTAFTNNDVVRFVDNLKASPYLTDVFLGETRQTAVEGVDIYSYKMQFKFKGV